MLTVPPGHQTWEGIEAGHAIPDSPRREVDRDMKNPYKCSPEQGGERAVREALLGGGGGGW